MRTLSLITAAICITLGGATVDNQLIRGSIVSLGPTKDSASVYLATMAENETNVLLPTTLRYQLDASKSKFNAHALAGGLLWFKGHDHLIAVRDFTGEVQLTPTSITPASLVITAKTASMVETSSVFTEPQKQIINRELREIVLHPDQYPEIIFRSTSVTGKATSSNQYDLKITGDLTLQGVTRQINIPTTITITGNKLRAQGKFSINRGDFKVKATSAVHGLVRVRKNVKFTFDIVGHQQ
jgi:polyisoprenoid-binding protein YceI